MTPRAMPSRAMSAQMSALCRNRLIMRSNAVWSRKPSNCSEISFMICCASPGMVMAKAAPMATGKDHERRYGEEKIPDLVKIGREISRPGNEIRHHTGKNVSASVLRMPGPKPSTSSTNLIA